MRGIGLRLGVLILVTGVLYAPVLGFDYVYEDLNDPDAFFRVGPAWVLLEDALVKPFRSLTGASFWLSHAFWPGPAGDHAGNLLIHLVNVGLLAVAASSVLPASGAIMAAGLFALHPVQVESVAYVSSRADLLAMTGVLIGLVGVTRRQAGWVLVGCLWAVLAKETFVMAGGLLALWAWRVGCRPSGAVWGGIVALAGCAGALLMASYAPRVSLAHVGDTLAQFWSLLSLVVWPVGLTIDHDWALLTPGMGVLALGGTLLLVAWSVRTRGWAAFAILWAFVCVLPRLGVPMAEGLHEHHLYGPMGGLTLSAGAWLARKA